MKVLREGNGSYELFCLVVIKPAQALHSRLVLGQKSSRFVPHQRLQLLSLLPRQCVRQGRRVRRLQTETDLGLARFRLLNKMAFLTATRAEECKETQYIPEHAMPAAFSAFRPGGYLVESTSWT